MANKTLLAQIKQRSDTAANWTAKNPIISDGELIIVTTNAGEKRFKVGDGEKTFTQLPYADENILSKIKNYTAGDGISISDTGVISSTGGGSSGNIVINVTTGPLDISTHIYSNCSSEVSYTLLKTVLDQHMPLEIVMNNNITMPVIETSQDNNSISLTGIRTNYYIKFTWDSSNNVQGFCFGRPIISDYDELYSSSGAAYWNASNNKWEIKDIASSSDTFYFEMSIDNNTEKITRLTKTYTEISEAIQARKNILVYIDGDLRPVVRSFTHDSYLQFFLQGNNYCVMCQLNSDNTSVCIRYLSPYIDKQSLESDVSGTVYWNPRNRSWSIKPAYKAGNGISISNDGTISVTAAKIYSGTSNAPSADLGENGDIYIQTEG